ncbi:hypothetical protein PR048_011937 [Dryococelus australis]|uniref:Uncharacterized protein n=1 Tax=Dryococelus australis TaxID=614101 RepID=A0ABQ9HN28_9NEOP|nr:hypothetical protein PR048_011937 [Dryococelus australis]
MQNFCGCTDIYQTVAKVIGLCLICAQTKAHNRNRKWTMGHVLHTEPLEIVVTQKGNGLLCARNRLAKKFISETGPQFCSDKWKTLTSVLKVELGYTAVYYLAANPVDQGIPIELMDMGKPKTILQNCVNFSRSDTENVVNITTVALQRLEQKAKQ